MLDRRRHGLARILCLAAAICVATSACGLEEGIERDELDRVDVPPDFQPVGDGEGTRFSYRVFTTELRRVSAESFDPPSSSYEETDTPGREIWEGWNPLVTWRGPTADKKRECVVAVELSTDREILEEELETEVEEGPDIDPDVRVVRVRASCHLPQHSFDR